MTFRAAGAILAGMAAGTSSARPIWLRRSAVTRSMIYRGGAVLADGQQLVALGRRGAGAGQLDPIQRFLKLTHAQAAAVYFRRAQQCKEIVRDVDCSGVEPQLVAAQFHTGHVHDAQKLGGVVQQLGVQAGKGFGKAVQLPDAGAGQLRHFFGFLRLNDFAVKDLGRE